MTADQRLERNLPTILDELYLGPTPTYRDEVMTVAVRRRQRPSWTFPGRWLPMADIASRSAFAPRVPWRTIGVALVITALLVVAAFVFVGSQQTRVPAPFGVARNGLIATSNHADIVVTDPVTGSSTTVVPGLEDDQRPMFSRDGTRLAFLRRSFDADGSRFRLVVGRADGSDLRVLPTPVGDTAVFEWAPDSRSLIVYVEPMVLSVDAVGSNPTVVISDDVVPTGRIGPAGSTGRILYQPSSIAEDALWILDLDGTSKRELIRKDAASSGQGDLSAARFSPDGTMIAFQQFPPNDTGQLRIFVMNADGSGVRQLDNEPGTWFEVDPAWSPDGKHIAFNRWRSDPTSDRWLPGIGVVSLDGGPVIAAGPTRVVSDGDFGFEWSPDGSTILSVFDRVDGSTTRPLAIDPFNGTSHELPVEMGSVTNWQRLAQ